MAAIFIIASVSTIAAAPPPASGSEVGGILVYQQKLGQQHDIFLSVDGGKTARNLTTHPADDTGARLSPDGSRVAFQSNRAKKLHLFVVPTAGGAAAQITSGPYLDEAPCWSPDGKTLYFDSHRSSRWQLCAVSASGGPVTAITTDGFDAMAPVVSPDGSRIACQLQRPGAENWSIAVLDLEGKIQFEITAPGAAFNETPAFSPDGKSIYFAATAAGGYDLFRAPASGPGPLARLTRWPGWKLHPVAAHGERLLLFDEKTPEGWRLGALDLASQAHFTLPAPGPCFSPDWRPGR